MRFSVLFISYLQQHSAPRIMKVPVAITVTPLVLTDDYRTYKADCTCCRKGYSNVTNKGPYILSLQQAIINNSKAARSNPETRALCIDFPKHVLYHSPRFTIQGAEINRRMPIPPDDSEYAIITWSV
jgi:hypothetical protein